MKKKIDYNRVKKIGKWTTQERRNDLKTMIRNSGLKSLPTLKVLGLKYGVSVGQVSGDVNNIIVNLDPIALDEIFTDFHETDMEALGELKDIIKNGETTDKIKAVHALVMLQRGTTELLEAFSKKSKVADKLQIESVKYTFNMITPKPKIIKMNEDE